MRTDTTPCEALTIALSADRDHSARRRDAGRQGSLPPAAIGMRWSTREAPRISAARARRPDTGVFAREAPMAAPASNRRLGA
jgi:hypothetical protein